MEGEEVVVVALDQAPWWGLLEPDLGCLGLASYRSRLLGSDLCQAVGGEDPSVWFVVFGRCGLGK